MILTVWKNMLEKLSPRDRRVVKIGAICGGLILAYAFVLAPWLEDWADTRRALAAERKKLELIDARGPAAARQAATLSVVPVLEMPESEEIQGPLFRGRLNEQLNKAGIKIKSLGFTPAVKSVPGAGFKLLRLQCRGKCDFSQVLDLLAHLNKNQYLVGIEEIRLKCDPKKRNEMDLTLTASTFCK